LKPLAEKTLEDGSVVTLLRDFFHAYYVGKKPDPDLEGYPMGAFRSEDAAKTWADHEFAGGEWRAVE
jgi:hypothetical protein